MATKQDLQQKTYKRFLDAVDLIAHKGYSINRATKEAGLSKNTFRAMNKERGNLVSDVYDPEKKTKSGKAKFLRYEVVEKTAYTEKQPTIVLDANGEATTVFPAYDKYFASIVSRYMHKVDELIFKGETDFSSIPDVVYDRDGKAYTLVKDVDTLIYFAEKQQEGYWSEIWEQFHSDKRR